MFALKLTQSPFAQDINRRSPFAKELKELVSEVSARELKKSRMANLYRSHDNGIMKTRYQTTKTSIETPRKINPWREIAPTETSWIAK